MAKKRASETKPAEKPVSHMEFTRKKKRGMNQKVERVWFSEGHYYKITWWSEAFGVTVTPHYYALVLTLRWDGKTYWDFAGKRGPYSKLTVAIEAAEKHQKLWKHAIAVASGERKGRSEKLRVLDQRARIGTKTSCQRLLGTVPAWVSRAVEPLTLEVIRNVIFPKSRSCQDDEDETTSVATGLSEVAAPSQSSENNSTSCSPPGSPSSLKTIPANGPASAVEVEAEAKSSMRKRSASTKSAPTKSSAQSAKEVVAAPAKRSRKSTTASSKTTKPTKPTTTRSRSSVAKLSRN